MVSLRSVGVHGEKYATRWAMKMRIDAAGGGHSRPTWTELMAFLKGDAFHEINEFRACVSVKGKRGSGRELHELHRSAIR